MNKSNTVVVRGVATLFLIVFISLFTCCGVKSGASNTLPGDVSNQRAPLLVDTDTDKLPVNSYVFTLSKGKVNKTGEYTRKEIESFLCANSFSYINTADLFRKKSDYAYIDNKVTVRKGVRLGYRVVPRYYLKPKTLTEDAKEAYLDNEISKWFEETVTVKCKGKFNHHDLNTTIKFFEQVNKVVGYKKFVFDLKATVTNIVVEFSADAPPRDHLALAGRAIILSDTLRVLFYQEKDDIKVETSRAVSDLLSNNSRMLRYTPEEMAFRKTNRLVKIYMTNVRSQQIRSLVLLHELLHAIGFSGHSPYAESYLYPVPMPVSNTVGHDISTQELLNNPLSTHALRLVEMLYRPEILPGMTLKEAGQVLAGLKLKSLTSNESALSFLVNQKIQLEQKRSDLLERTRFQIRRKPIIHRLLYELGGTRELLREEVLEKENKLPPHQTKGKSLIKIIALNRQLVRQRLSEVESQIKRLKTTSDVKSGPQIRRLKRQVQLRKEDIGIWDKLDKEYRETLTTMRKLESEELRINDNDEMVMKTLRRIIRQLSSIKAEVSRL